MLKGECLLHFIYLNFNSYWMYLQIMLSHTETWFNIWETWNIVWISTSQPFSLCTLLLTLFSFCLPLCKSHYWITMWDSNWCIFYIVAHTHPCLWLSVIRIPKQLSLFVLMPLCMSLLTPDEYLNPFWKFLGLREGGLAQSHLAGLEFTLSQFLISYLCHYPKLVFMFYLETVINKIMA